MICLGTTADSCDGSERLSLDTAGQDELIRVLRQGDGHVAKSICGGELIILLEGQTDPNAAVTIELNIECTTLPCYLKLEAGLKPPQQMLLTEGQPVTNGKLACVWSCPQWQTGGGFFAFPVLREWCRFYAWRDFRSHGALGDAPDHTGNSYWIPSDANQYVRNEVSW